MVDEEAILEALARAGDYGDVASLLSTTVGTARKKCRELDVHGRSPSIRRLLAVQELRRRGVYDPDAPS